MSKKNAEVATDFTPLEQPDVVMRTMRVEMLKPLDRDWPTFGKQLFALRNIAHRCLQGAITNIVRYDTPKLETPLNPKSGKAYSPQTLAYHGAKDAVDGYNEWTRTMKPRKDEARPPEVYVPSATITGWANEAFARWKQWGKGGRATQLPSFKHGASIFIPDIKLRADEQGRPIATLKIDHKVEDVAIVPGQGGNWRVVDAMANQTLEASCARIVYDPNARKKNGTKGKWYLLISYPATPKEVAQGDTWLAVHRGTRNLFTLLCTGGQPWKRIPGGSLAHQKRCLLARMADIKQSINAGEIGSGARGRGRKVRYRSYTKIEDTLERMLQTRIQQIAARVVGLAQLWGCAGIIIEDYGGIDPHSLTEGQRRSIVLLPASFAKDAIISAATKAGLQIRTVSARYISTTCPACANTNAANHRVRTGKFRCTVCAWGHEADYVASYHMSQAGLLPTEPNPIRDRLADTLRLRKKLMEAAITRLEETE